MNKCKVSYELERLQYGWVACLRCLKTFFKMTDARCHYESEHFGKNEEAIKNTPQSELVRRVLHFDQFTYQGGISFFNKVGSKSKFPLFPMSPN